MIDLEERYLDLVREIVARHVPGLEVRMFGSRVNGTARRYSDIDLAIVGRGELPPAVISALRDAFSESDLPFRVDLVDWHAISPEFRRAMERQGSAVIQGGDPS